ncbi:MAG: nicotinate-nucleotide adenylyltransferase [Muribaculaceae bacterium]|nr:nicotinate-nucleotide adenylyltransferase [Muribaculaceae bacterium]
MTIGIYGGSFNPVHTGHALLANFVAQSGKVDEVWLMVSPLNPLKADKKHSSSLLDNHVRLKMVEMVASECQGVKASDFEFGLPIPSYTYRTLCSLRESYPQHRFRLIIGGDNWEEFDRWRNPQEIIEEFGVLIYPRPGHEVGGPLPAGVEVLEGVPTAEISSTMVREMVKDGKNINFLVPLCVARHIEEMGYYR